jgi:hypothetical protein
MNKPTALLGKIDWCQAVRWHHLIIIFWSMSIRKKKLIGLFNVYEVWSMNKKKEEIQIKRWQITTMVSISNLISFNIMMTQHDMNGGVYLFIYFMEENPTCLCPAQGRLSLNLNKWFSYNVHIIREESDWTWKPAERQTVNSNETTSQMSEWWKKYWMYEHVNKRAGNRFLTFTDVYILTMTWRGYNLLKGWRIKNSC